MLKHGTRVFSSASGPDLATRLFLSPGSAEFLTSVSSLSQGFPDLGNAPEVVVTGRANSGKSSLFNAVLGRTDLIRTSKKAGHTRKLDFFRVGPREGGLILVDAPGYGARGREEWGGLFDKYVRERQELKRVYITFSSTHPLNHYDTGMLEHLSSSLSERPSLSIQSILTKADSVKPNELPGILKEVKQNLRGTLALPPIVTSAKMSPPFGIDQVRRNIVDTCGLGAIFVGYLRKD